MQDTKCRIETDATDTRPFGSSCEWKSILQLKPGSRFGSYLVDAIVALVGDSAVPEPKPVYLGAEIYTEIKKWGFGASKRWVKDIDHKRQWSFGVCDDNHWVAVRVDWVATRVDFYDPQGFRAHPRRKRITNVSKKSSYFFLVETRKLTT